MGQPQDSLINGATSFVQGKISSAVRSAFPIMLASHRGRSPMNLLGGKIAARGERSRNFSFLMGWSFAKETSLERDFNEAVEFVKISKVCFELTSSFRMLLGQLFNKRQPFGFHRLILSVRWNLY